MYKKSILENGIRILTEHIDHVRSISIGILVDAGPANEKINQSGLAHFTEHLMLQGTINRNYMEISQLIDSAGGLFDAFTGRDYTCYSATILDDYRTYLLDLFGDIFKNSIFPPENLENEKHIILREINMSDDMPDQRVHTLLKSGIWQNHSLGKPIAGEPQTVSGLTREDVIYFVNKYYLSNRMIISAAGNVNHDDFKSQVEDSFWQLTGNNKDFSSTIPDYNSGVFIEYKQVSHVYFSIGIKVHAYAHKDRYSLHILNTILGGGISSRLYKRIREKLGIVYEINSEYHAYKDAGLIVIEGSTTPEHIHHVLCYIFIEVTNLLSFKDAVDDEELWKTKMQIKGQHIISSENTNTCMSRLLNQEFYFNRYISSDEIISQIKNVDKDNLKSVCRDIKKDFSKTSIALVGPEMPDYYDSTLINQLLFDFTQKE